MGSRILWRTECLLTNAKRNLNFANVSPVKLFWRRQLHPGLPRFGVTTVRMPSLSPTMTDGMIVSWVKKEGDAISPGDVLCEIQTDKAVVSLECDDEGIFAKILVKENSPEVKVGTPIALWVDSGDDWKNVEIPKDLEISSTTSSSPSAAASQSKPTTSSRPDQGTSDSSQTTRPFGPAVRSSLSRYGLDPSEIPSTGPHGMLLKNDVISFVNSNKIEPVKIDTSPTATESDKSRPSAVDPKLEIMPAPFRDIPISSMRRTIAKRLLQSKSEIPHAYGTIDCSIGKLMKLRKKIQNAGLKVSLNDFLIKITGNALAKCPQLNTVWEGEELNQKGRIDISVAVSTETGLITPIVTNIAEKDVIDISVDIRALASKARAGKLQPNEFIGGTFTISNLGMYGVHHFTAIINPPQCAILAIGGSTLTIDKNSEVDTRVCFTLSYDARAVLQEEAAKFLAHLKDEVESPSETSMNIFDLQHRIEQMQMLNEL